MAWRVASIVCGRSWSFAPLLHLAHLGACLGVEVRVAAELFESSRELGVELALEARASTVRVRGAQKTGFLAHLPQQRATGVQQAFEVLQILNVI